MAHHVAPDGSIYADTGFLNSLRLPNVELRHIGFGEFVVKTPKGEVEFDRMRGKPFPGMSGRSHLLYDNGGKMVATEWLIAEAEKHKLSERTASLRERAIKLAHVKPELRAPLLAALRAAGDSDWAAMFPRGSYLNLFFSEKEIPSKVFSVQDSSGMSHQIPNGVVVEAISQTSGAERKKIEDTIRKIDFHNGDVNHFFEHLAKALAEQYAGNLRFAGDAATIRKIILEHRLPGSDQMDDPDAAQHSIGTGGRRIQQLPKSHTMTPSMFSASWERRMREGVQRLLDVMDIGETVRVGHLNVTRRTDQVIDIRVV